MPRAPKLCRHKGHWCTKAGSPEGVYFGKIGEVSYQEAKTRFANYLAELSTERKPEDTTNYSTTKVCREHLRWCKRERSESLFNQRRTILTQFCEHKIGEHNGKRLPGYGKKIKTLRAADITRAHVEQFLSVLAKTPTKKTKKPPKDKTIRANVVAIKATFNWCATPVTDGGGGLFPDSHRPLAKIPRGYVAPKDLTEADLPTDEEVEILFRWAAVDPSMKQEKNPFKWRRRLPDESYSPESQVFADMLRAYDATGARTGELCNALVRDYMPRTSQICLGKHKRVRTQSNPTVRNIQVDVELAEILKRNVRGKQADDPLFVQGNGKPWNPTLVNRRLNKIIELAAEHEQFVRQHITPYSFRDLYISELLMLGTEPFKVAKMAGTSLREIERTYGHFFNRDLAEAQSRLKAERTRRRKETSTTNKQ